MVNGPISRNDNSLIGRWWWNVDRWTLFSVLLLSFIGLFLVFASSPSVSERIGLDSFYFVKRHVLYIIFGLWMMLTISMLSLKNIKRFSLILFFISIVAMVFTIFTGFEIKGAKRWMSLFGLSLQPSEFLKPSFSILVAWMFSEKRLYPEFPGMIVSIFLYFISVLLLLMQPDLGMVVLISFVWFSQLFLAGLSMIWVFSAFVFGAGGLGVAYLFLPHVTKRIDQFLIGSNGDRFSDQYQITQSIESFMNGGFWGRGPGEGIIKNHLPDSHADFIFAVAGEEFGIIVCSLIVAIFVFIVLRNIYRMMSETNLFIVLAVSGLIIQFGLQAMINIMSTLSLIPTKGMTLPFISFGGSSLLSICILIGMVLGLTKEKEYGELF